MTTNTEALASPIYNPTMDSNTMDIFKLMQDYPDDLMAQYRDVIMNMPTKNAFTAVIQNPRECEIRQARQDIDAIYTGLNVRWPGLQTALQAAQALPPGPQRDQAINQAQSDINAYNTCQADLQTVESCLDETQDHTDRLVSNLPNIMGLVQGALGLLTALAGLLNPCAGTGDFLGSLMDKGRQIMEQIQRAIQSVMAIINEGISLVRDAIAKVMNMAMAMVAMVRAEIEKLIKALIDSVRVGLAQLLGSLGNDPCLSAIFKSVGTGALIGVAASL